MSSDKVQAIVESVEKLTVLELTELVKALEERFGVKAAQIPVGAFAGMQAQAAPTEVAKPQEEKTEFAVYLTAVGDKKLQVVKEVRALTNLGLKEAKELVEGTLPALVKDKLSKKEAEDFKAKLEAVGATVEIK